eukprot:CAMPEP_0171391814 /NCGR_PEP_ID=MMETSP0880-20121228/1528_1 /TAXON_ID=67004 /ORGANISM="Thalassiosira weissflogii, Strain CCMP1336" /LENGTH=1734 /DNA_ID=CAMNT_0011904567 /DNA_START=216 /DNA_END=5420 /DNA_ORIENTATION=+
MTNPHRRPADAVGADASDRENDLSATNSSSNDRSNPPDANAHSNAANANDNANMTTPPGNFINANNSSQPLSINASNSDHTAEFMANSSSHSNTPLTGESIVLTSSFGDGTPVAIEGEVANEDFSGKYRSNSTATADTQTHANTSPNTSESAANNANQDHTNSGGRGRNNVNVGADEDDDYRGNAESPPPDSVHSSVLTSLSPPPISTKSAEGGTSYHATGGGGNFASHNPPGSIHSRSSGGGSGLFQSQSQSQSQQQAQTIQMQQQAQTSQPQQPPIPGRTKRPPLPPRWAIHGAPLPASHHGGMSSNVDSPYQNPNANDLQQANNPQPPQPFLPPPQQIGPVSHRRVVSTGDASFLSNLTDPDSIPDADERETSGGSGDGESPPVKDVMGVTTSSGVGAGVASGNANANANVAAPSNAGVVCHNYNITGGGMATSTAAGNSNPNANPNANANNPTRKRGVSWDFDNVAGSNNINTATNNATTPPYYPNEQEAFESVGILQPILSDDEDVANVGASVDVTVSNPVASAKRNSGNENVIETAVTVGDAPSNTAGGTTRHIEMMDHVQASSLPAGAIQTNANTTAINAPPPSQPPPPPPPKLILGKHKHTKSAASTRTGKDLWNIAKAGGPSLGSKPSKPKLVARAVSEFTQFGDEADLAILEALKMHNMPSTHVLNGSDDGGSGYRDDAGETKEEEYPEEITPDITASHRKNISSLTQFRTPKGEHRFEDACWNETYETQGRIDGSLREEKDSQVVDEEKEGMELYIPPLGEKQSAVSGPAVATASAAPPPAAAPKRPPLHPLRSIRKTSDASSATGGAKQHARGPSKVPTGGEAEKETKEKQGLRHRRRKTGKGFTSMAEELAQMAAVDDGGAASNQQHHRRKATAMTEARGLDNLLDGVNVLLERDSSLGGGESDDDDGGDDGDNDNAAVNENSQENTATNTDSPTDDNQPHDEETGEAHTKRDKAKAALGHVIHHRRRRQTKAERRNEMFFHLLVWYNDLIRPKLPIFIKGAIHGCFFVILPLLIVAFALYYGAGNPMAGEPTFDENGKVSEPASWSWWVLFVVRQFFLLSCVKAGEVISIDILALRTPIFIKTIGSFATLMIVQARGWPYVIMFWGIVDFAFLFGYHKFALHWLFWQDWLDVFTMKNPPGNFLSSSLYLRILLCMIFVGLFTALKRLWLATFLGRRSYDHYGPELEKVLGKMLLVSQIAHLARQIEAQVVTSRVNDGYAYTMQTNVKFPGATSESEEETPVQQGRKVLDENLPGTGNKNSGGSGTDSPGDGFGQDLLNVGIGPKHATGASSRGLDKFRSDTMKNIGSSSRLQIMSLLEEWEEPEIRSSSASKATIKDILQFRQAISLMDDKYPFTPAFGQASTRAICVDSSDSLYDRLLESTPDKSLLPFETLSQIAYDNKGNLMRDKAKALIRLFRPDRRGYLTKLDFVSSIDTVYKDLRLFRASLANSSTIDDSFESIMNVLTAILAICGILLIIGFNQWKAVSSLAAFLVSFSFMFGAASSKYFEGILLIFVRRPYDIGDKIALSDPSTDTSASGSSTWFVEKVTLFTTTVRFATTNEVATYSNGSLAPLRIINAKRSPKAVVYVYHKFGSDAPFKMVKVFQTAIENFVKSRPREWVALNGFRATRVEMELNFIEYVVVLTHREMWQNIGPILQSQADLASFGLEVSKKLNLRYISPPKPIHLSTEKSGRNKYIESDSTMGGKENEINQVAEMFRNE